MVRGFSSKCVLTPFRSRTTSTSSIPEEVATGGVVVAEDHGEHEEEVPYDEEGGCMAGGCQLL